MASRAYALGSTCLFVSASGVFALGIENYSAAACWLIAACVSSLSYFSLLNYHEMDILSVSTYRARAYVLGPFLICLTLSLTVLNLEIGVRDGQDVGPKSNYLAAVASLIALKWSLTYQLLSSRMWFQVSANQQSDFSAIVSPLLERIRSRSRSGSHSSEGSVTEGPGAVRTRSSLPSTFSSALSVVPVVVNDDRVDE
jgi:hypothetical protein